MTSITSATFDLAVPPSTNAAYTNVPGVGRVKTKAYREWIRGELKVLIAQRAQPVTTPVSIEIFLPLGVRGDASNRIKATEDILVRAGVIPDDDKKYVRSVSVSFHEDDSPLMRVVVKTV